MLAVSHHEQRRGASVSPLSFNILIHTGRLLTLTDTQYRIDARLNLRLQPFANMGELPDSCPLCSGKHAKDAIVKDGWHFLSCKSQTKREIVKIAKRGKSMPTTNYEDQNSPHGKPVQS